MELRVWAVLSVIWCEVLILSVVSCLLVNRSSDDGNNLDLSG